MTPEEQRALAALLRRFVKIMAERRCLITILDEAVEGQRSPTRWRDDFENLRQSPHFRAFLEEFEPMIVRLEQGADIDELIPLLQKITEGKLPN